MGKLQNEDFKTLAELTGAGGAASQLLNDTKIYVSAGSLNKQLSQAITDGDIGGVSAAESSSLSLTGGSTVTIGTKAIQSIRVQGASAAVALSSTPFGSSAPTNLTEVTLIGNDDTNTVSVSYSDAAKGCVGNFSTLELAKYQVATFRYLSSIDRWVYVR
jgi:hypothetical protein